MRLFPQFFSCIRCISWFEIFRFKILVSFDDVDTLQFKERRGLTADFTDDTDGGRRGQDRAWELGGSAGAGPRQKQKLGIRRRSEAMAGQEQKAEIPIKKSNAETLK